MLSVVVLGLVAMCSITSAQVSWINGYSTITETQTTQTTNSTVPQGTKDLSEFWSRLTNRLWEVLQEVVGLVTNGLKQTGTQNSVSTSSTDMLKQETNSTSPEVTTSQIIQSSFTDVQTIQEKYFVDTLASHGIIKGTDGRFSPENYTRLGDFIKIVVDTYRTKVGYNITTDAGLTNKTYFMGGIVPVSLEKAVNTAYELGFLDDVLSAKDTTKADFDSFLTTNTIDQMLTNIGNEFPGLITKPKMELSDLYVKRGVMTKYVGQGFKLVPMGNDFITLQTTQKHYFNDINDNPYKNAIQKLANLDIINSESKKFYPDNYVKNYEFVVMLVKAHLASTNKKIDLDSYTDHSTSFVDLDSQSVYVPFVKYAQENNLINYLTATDKENFHPNQTMSKQSVYTMLQQVNGNQLPNISANAGSSKMTRGEFASLLVQAFNLNTLSQSTSNTQSQTENITSESTIESTANDLSLLLKIKALLATI